MIELLTQKEKAKTLGQKAKQKSSKYTWEALVEKNIKLITSVIANKRTRE